MGAELFNADERTDMTRLIVAFQSFANVPKNSVINNILLLKNWESVNNSA
jgi:hypothetical protein